MTKNLLFVEGFKLFKRSRAWVGPVLVFLLIIISYVSIIPEDDVPILENEAKLIKEEKNNFSNNKNTVYEILEKKEKSIEDIIEKELENKQDANLDNKFEKIRKSNSNKVVSTKKKFKHMQRFIRVRLLHPRLYYDTQSTRVLYK